MVAKTKNKHVRPPFRTESNKTLKEHWTMRVAVRFFPGSWGVSSLLRLPPSAIVQILRSVGWEPCGDKRYQNVKRCRSILRHPLAFIFRPNVLIIRAPLPRPLSIQAKATRQQNVQRRRNAPHHPTTSHLQTTACGLNLSQQYYAWIWICWVFVHAAGPRLLAWSAAVCMAPRNYFSCSCLRWTFQ